MVRWMKCVFGWIARAVVVFCYRPFFVFAFFSCATRKIAVAITTDPIWRNLLFRFVASIPSRGFACPAEVLRGITGFNSRLVGLAGNLGRCSGVSFMLVWREYSPGLSLVNLFWPDWNKEAVAGLATWISKASCWFSRLVARNALRGRSKWLLSSPRGLFGIPPARSGIGSCTQLSGFSFWLRSTSVWRSW